MKIKQLIKPIILVAMILVIAACSLKPVKMPPQKSYLLDVRNPHVVHARKTPVTLLVALPAADPGFGSSQMAYEKIPFQLQYYAKHQWVASPAKMLLPLMVEALAQTGHFHSVVSPPYTGVVNLRLNSRVVQFVQDFTQTPSIMHIKIRVQLLDTYTQKIIATRLFRLSQAAPSDNAYGQVRAANKVTRIFLSELTRFVVAKTYRIRHR